MLKLLIYVCLFGLCLNTATVFGESEYEYYDIDESKEMPMVNEKEEKPTKHKVEPLDEHEGITNEIEIFKNNFFDNDAQYDSIEDYQIEDNRFEEDVKDEDLDLKNKLISKDADLPLKYVVQPLNEDIIKSTKSKDQLRYHDGFEEDIKTYLDETQDETSNKDILDETEAILNEDTDNNISDIKPNNKKNGKYSKETSQIDGIDNDFNENTKNTASEPTKTFSDLRSELDELKIVQSKLGQAFHNDSDDETKFDFDLSEEADDDDYQEIDDDNLYKIFSDKKKENIYDDEELGDEFPVQQKEQIYYSNDALSASDSTPAENATISGASKTTESTIQSQTTQIDTTIQSLTETDTLSAQATTKADSQEKSEMPEFTDLDVKDQDKFYEKYKVEREAHSAATNIFEVHLTINDSTTLTSPDYPNNYPTNQITDYVITGEGQGIELNITDFSINSFLGDYVLVIPGETEEKGSDGILLTYALRSERRFRFTDVDRMFIRFEAKAGQQFQQGFNMSLRNIMVRQDLVEQPDPEEDRIYFTSNETLSVNLGGVNMNGFISKEEEFRRLIADMATLYINTKGIEPGLNTTLEVAQILSRGLCFHNWPGSELCTEIVFSVPLVYENETLETRLTKKDLREMWDTYSGKDPFAVRLERMGIQEFTYPDDKTTLTAWLVIATGVVISMAMLAFALWRFSCFEEYTKMPTFSDTDSLNEKKVLDLYPTPHQTLPPLYTDDNIKWADDVYCTKDVGFSNKSYMQDVYDMDSDDEALRTPDMRYTTDV